jgi:hypothetical protein
MMPGQFNSVLFSVGSPEGQVRWEQGWIDSPSLQKISKHNHPTQIIKSNGWFPHGLCQLQSTKKKERGSFLVTYLSVYLGIFALNQKRAAVPCSYKNYDKALLKSLNLIHQSDQNKEEKKDEYFKIRQKITIFFAVCLIVLLLTGSQENKCSIPAKDGSINELKSCDPPKEELRMRVLRGYIEDGG